MNAVKTTYDITNMIPLILSNNFDTSNSYFLSLFSNAQREVRTQNILNANDSLHNTLALSLNKSHLTHSFLKTSFDTTLMAWCNI